ncbi:ORFL174C.iORF2 [Human betaherpesvirus 5]|nr:ORFL174C.iORF2 [Human betaherpesvirus 5]QHX40516.1 ORFL174C.iORF2 [Human betaherpesvirus 5]
MKRRRHYRHRSKFLTSGCLPVSSSNNATRSWPFTINTSFGYHASAKCPPRWASASISPKVFSALPFTNAWTRNSFACPSCWNPGCKSRSWMSSTSTTLFSPSFRAPSKAISAFSPVLYQNPGSS